ncbi:hypothetical protein CLFE_038370 [Clostridium felsineum DSM 794]|nr:hypothetical protein CLFE_038370 [Clostridium felsineum DSM 794]
MEYNIKNINCEGDKMKIIEQSPNEEASLVLLEELSKCLKDITGSSGKSSFNSLDVLVPRSLFIVAYDENENAVGCGAFRPINKEIAEVKRVYAKIKAKGIGKKILIYLENEAHKRGYSALVLETRKVNLRAVNFYKAMGYVATANYGKYVGNTEAICFRKEI